MATEVVMPALEMAQEAGTLVRWLKSEGEHTAKGEPLFEIETDKVVVEIEARESGILSNVSAQAGDVVPVGQVIALLRAADESASTARAVPATPVAKRLASAHGVSLDRVPVTGHRISKDDVLHHLQTASSPTAPRLQAASPKARRLAVEYSLNLSEVVGTGPEGAVRVADIENERVKRSAPDQAAAAPSAQPYHVRKLTGIRKTIAERLQASYQQAPHITLSVEAEMSEALRLLDDIRPAVQSRLGVKVGITAILIRAVTATLIEHPRLNAHLVDDEIREFESINIGVAVALDDGLIVPVIHQAERLGCGALEQELQQLSEQARAGTLTPREVHGGTFTISNLGMFGIRHFTAILNPPEVGILAVGAIEHIPIGVDGEIVLRPMLHLTLTADHRAVDGAVAAVFLRTLKQQLQRPYLLLA